MFFKPQADEIVRQVMIARTDAFPSAGHILWNFRPVLQNKSGVAGELKKHAFQSVALTPAYPWLSRKLPAAPDMVAIPQDDGSVSIRWAEAISTESPAQRWILQIEQNGRWSTRVLESRLGRWDIPADGNAPSKISVFALDRYGLAGPPSGLRLDDSAAVR